MRRATPRRLSAAAAAPLLFIVARSASADDAIAIDATKVTQHLADTFHGVNYAAFWDASQGSATSAAALALTATRVVRFPGGDPGDWYDWQCPYYTSGTPACPAAPTSASWSSTSTADLFQWAKPFGGILYLQTNYQGNSLPNPPSQTYAVNSPENAAAWATWTQKQGIPALFEIGNEEDINMKQADDAVFQPYITAFDAQARAIHGASAATTVIGPAGTNEYYWWALDSLGMFLKAEGNKNGTGQVDAVSLHFYSGTAWSDSMGIPQAWAASGGPWEFIQQTISANDSRKLPVYISEWNLGNASGAVNTSVGHALLIADMIGAFADAGVAGHEYFDVHCASACDPNSWGLLYGGGDGAPLDTPTINLYAMALWRVMGTQMLSLTQSADPASAVSAHATTRGDGSVQVMAINKTASSQPLAITLTGYTQKGGVSEYLLASAGDETSTMASYNGSPNPSAGAALPGPKTSAFSGTTYSYTLAPFAAVVLDFAGSGVVPDAGAGSSGGTSSGAAASSSGGGGSRGMAGGGSSASSGGATTGTGKDAGSAGGTTGGPDGGNQDTGGLGASSGGCGCASAGATRGGALAAVVVLSALLARRRRRAAGI
jgi:MYXO-CTERM domain-containing protein